MSDHIHVDVDAGVLTLRIARPDKRNAITQEMYGALAEAFARAEREDTIRLIRLGGQGGTFTAGNDLADFLAAGALRTDGPTMTFLRAVATGTKLLVAEVDGPAIGIGTTVLLHCDLVYASARSVFALPFVPLGVVPEFGSSLLLPRRVGPAAAARLLYFGEPFDATQASRLGLVTEVLPDADALRARVDDRIAALLAQPAQALAATRALLHDSAGPQVLARIEDEAVQFARQLESAQTRAAIAARLPGGSGGRGKPGRSGEPEVPGEPGRSGR
ncbi:enoyl-CoA hydratase-related protein [Frankia sp. R82]|uniref:enoyl-CoA hydratase-related protein n=1 Tax=Frankia sp. R82 TaxID=2950553 RepID=UPI002044BE9A|nr:enoyl-CoA hydratase-related protein [Frankia sp. R82]MCM3887480.1 enoyl-CoA hydratase-related protein [Frankia sp. R82]